MARFLGLLVGGSLLAMACSSPGSGGGGGAGGFGSAGSGADYCGALCGKHNQCDSSLDLQTCLASCQNTNAAVGPKLRGEFVSRVTSCYQAKDCASVLNSNALPECFDTAAAALAPSGAGSAFCDNFSVVAKKCGGTTNDANCLATVKQFSDVTIQNAGACLAKACSEIDSCVAAHFGSSNSSSAGNDSCEWAYDGYCDHGGACQYGTDTYDCS